MRHASLLKLDQLLEDLFILAGRDEAFDVDDLQIIKRTRDIVQRLIATP